MITVVGTIADKDGLASRPALVPGSDRPELLQRSWSSPADAYRRAQPSWIGIDTDHDGRWIGEVVYLERDRHDNLWAIGEVRELPLVHVRVGDELVTLAAPLYWSASRWSDEDGGDLLFHSVALTTSPARIAPRPVDVYDGPLHRRSSWTLNRHDRELLTRAYETNLRRRTRDPIAVHEEHEYRRTDRGAWFDDRDELVYAERGRPPGRMRYGPTVRNSILSVS